MSNLTQGGQTQIHSFRMNVVIFRFIVRFFLLVFVIFLAGTLFIKTDKKTLKNTHDYYQAKIISLYQKDFNHKINLKQNGVDVKVKIGNVLNDRGLINSKNNLTEDILSSVRLSVIMASILTVLLIVRFYIKGRGFNQSKHIRGGNIVKPRLLRKLVRRYNRRVLFIPRLVYRIRRILTAMGLLDNTKHYNQKQKKYIPYTVASGVPYPAHTETQHTLITGGSGTGKTQMLKHLLTQIKAKGDRAIVYDKMGSFIPHFYEPEKGDTILNPFDKRSPVWSIFNEVEENLQLDSIASALMPISKNISDPFWVQASRTIFTSVTSKLKEKGETSNRKLVDNLLQIDLSDIAEMIKGTPAQAIIDERSPKTALSVMSVLSTYLSSLKYLKDPVDGGDVQFDNNGEIVDKKNKTFSIRDWVKDDSNSSCLFISSRGDQHESLKPLISTWLEIGINSLLSLKQNRNRRIWVILDELPSLHMLPSLNSGIAESRQFGGCFVLSLQLMAQLRSIYGKDDAETISGLAKTRVIFSSPDEDTARWCSNALGKKEQREIKKNISYGAHDVRDGVSLNVHQSTENLVIPTEIMNLNNLECYLKLPFNFPVTKAKIKVHKSKEIAERFVRDYSAEVIGDNSSINNGSDNTNNTSGVVSVEVEDNIKPKAEPLDVSVSEKEIKQDIPQITKPPQRKNSGFLEGNPFEIRRIMAEGYEKEKEEKRLVELKKQEDEESVVVDKVDEDIINGVEGKQADVGVKDVNNTQNKTMSQTKGWLNIFDEFDKNEEDK
jgi:type IV conjugative transfer system coupling protein TraD